jgi:hypothetical protein
MNMVGLWYNYYWRYCGRAFGEIEDEHDLDEELIKGTGRWYYFFRLDLTWVSNQTYKLNIPESDFNGTLGVYRRFH